MLKRKYGWKPDYADHRDYIYKAKKRTLRSLPPVVDLRNECSIVEDQGDIGSCTANALAGNIELLDKRIDNAYSDVSRLFIYYNERIIENSVNEDAGAHIRDGIKTLAKDGYCSEVSWPYDITKWAIKPTNKCYKEAKGNKIKEYQRLTTTEDMLACLADGFPITFGITLYESFESAKVAKTGIVNMPGMVERTVGGHAVLMVGYDLKAKRFLVRNSWGSDWGQEGYFTIPFKYVEELGDDFWTIRKK